MNATLCQTPYSFMSPSVLITCLTFSILRPLVSETHNSTNIINTSNTTTRLTISEASHIGNITSLSSVSPRFNTTFVTVNSTSNSTITRSIAGFSSSNSTTHIWSTPLNNSSSSSYSTATLSTIVRLITDPSSTLSVTAPPSISPPLSISTTSPNSNISSIYSTTNVSTAHYTTPTTTTTTTITTRVSYRRRPRIPHLVPEHGRPCRSRNPIKCGTRRPKSKKLKCQWKSPKFNCKNRVTVRAIPDLLRETNFPALTSSSFMIELEKCGTSLLRPGTFEDRIWKRVTELKLLECKIEDIEPHSFAPMTSLRKLVIAKGDFTKLTPNMTKGLQNLRNLTLIHGMISRIASGTFAQMTGLFNLDLTGNKLRCLYPGTFDGLVNVREINLNKNKFSILPDGIFAPCLSLRKLQVSKNVLFSFNRTVLEGSSFDKPHNVSGRDFEINLRGNELCDEDYTWLQEESWVVRNDSNTCKNNPVRNMC